MSQTLLHIDASPRSEGSVSRGLSAKIVAQQNAGEVIRRDLSEPLPFLNETWVAGTFTPPEDRSDAQRAELVLSDQLVAEVQAADTIVIGTPIYNFGAPAVLKAWIDQVARAGVTFKYTETGPVGLLSDKKVIVAVASGGVSIGSPADFLTPHLRVFLGFLGLTDVSFVDVDSYDATAIAAE